MKIFITEGTQDGDIFKEINRFAMDVPEDTTIGQLLEMIKERPLKMKELPVYPRLEEYLYLMDSQKRERLDELKTLSECGMQENDTFRLMSSVR